MKARGYPVSTEFQQNAADLSVDHPHVVEHYRVASEIAARQEAGKANTEDLRNAMVSYRTLFEELQAALISQHGEQAASRSTDGSKLGAIVRSQRRRISRQNGKECRAALWTSPARRFKKRTP